MDTVNGTSSSHSRPRAALGIACLAIMVVLPITHAAACHAVLMLFPRAILFYTGVTLLALIAPLTALAGWLILSTRRGESAAVSTGAVIATTGLSAAITLTFFVLVPVTLDRSISTFLLSRLEAAEASGGLTVTDLTHAFEVEYIGRHRAIERRIDEQLVGGTIRPVGGDAYALSRRGRDILRWARAVAAAYGVTDTYVTAPDAAVREAAVGMSGAGADHGRPRGPGPWRE